MTGPSNATRRDITRPGSWRGLSADDATLLAVWVERFEERPIEFHTDIPLGTAPCDSDPRDPVTREQSLEAVYCRRADALVLWPDGWEIVEAKPYGTPQALGQLLHYALLLSQLQLADPIVRRTVVAQFIAGECDAFYAMHDVNCVQVGQVLSR